MVSYYEADASRTREEILASVITFCHSLASKHAQRCQFLVEAIADWATLPVGDVPGIDPFSRGGES